MLGALVALNAGYYRWFARMRGWRFALAVVPMHFLHHLCNGASFLAGSFLYAARSAGVRLPGAIAPSIWPADPRYILEPQPPMGR
jgi:hypothetical protein